MVALLLAAVLSLLFFSAVLAVELRHGEGTHIRELLVIVGLLMAVASYAGHVLIVDHWPVLASACEPGGPCG